MSRLSIPAVEMMQQPKYSLEDLVMEGLRITIRNPDPGLLDLFRQTARDNEISLGECFNQSVEAWCKRIPEFDETMIRAEDYCN